jgi:hypothetical protein
MRKTPGKVSEDADGVGNALEVEQRHAGQRLPRLETQFSFRLRRRIGAN